MSIYNLSIFEKSTLRFTRPDGGEWEIVAVLDPVQFRQNETINYDRSEFIRIYEGHIVSITPQDVQGLEEGVFGTGEIHETGGKVTSGQVKLLDIVSSSLPLANGVFGQRIEVGYVQRMGYIDANSNISQQF
ncbi:hypothetical protein [Brasilonema sp. UFV-L1]|uniref:hypothetical protein n=1 Tax=Brasilonema sp. UFV-L1 TaxID=2234130 RepID=UPI00145D2B06|nr:hypothetical protein [Brasilonema sp. UFV-L1]NMG11884.1 hypothetical protein [Brasilonema sp. UFV-L1]